METRSPNRPTPQSRKPTEGPNGRQRLKYRKCLACVADRREAELRSARMQGTITAERSEAACSVCGGSGWELVEIEFDLPWPASQ